MGLAFIVAVVVVVVGVGVGVSAEIGLPGADVEPLAHEEAGPEQLRQARTTQTRQEEFISPTTPLRIPNSLPLKKPSKKQNGEEKRAEQSDE